MDDSLPFILNIFLAQVVGVIGPIVVTTYAVPWIIIGTYTFSIKFAFQKKKDFTKSCFFVVILSNASFIISLLHTLHCAKVQKI